jgi:hypothetical protein
VLETYSSGYCTGLTPVSLSGFYKNPSPLCGGKNTLFLIINEIDVRYIGLSFEQWNNKGSNLTKKSKKNVFLHRY